MCSGLLLPAGDVFAGVCARLSLDLVLCRSRMPSLPLVGSVGWLDEVIESVGRLDEVVECGRDGRCACSGCSGSSNCTGCTGCSDCTGCSGCTGCSDCSDCSDCTVSLRWSASCDFSGSFTCSGCPGLESTKSSSSLGGELWTRCRVRLSADALSGLGARREAAALSACRLVCDLPNCSRFPATSAADRREDVQHDAVRCGGSMASASLDA
jgi:hypothetical protein